MAAVKYYDDGDWTIPRQHGPALWRFPFSNKGDNVSFEYLVTYRIDAASYSPLQAMTKIRTPKGDAYLVEEGATRYIGNGILEWTRIFASVPVTRLEGTTIVFAWQFNKTVPPSIAEVTRPMNGKLKSEYSLIELPQISAPSVAIVFDTTYYFGGFGFLRPGMTIAAQNSASRIYKGLIYVRETILITLPSFIT